MGALVVIASQVRVSGLGVGLKALIKRLLVLSYPFVFWVLAFFFDKSYLKGRYYDSSLLGIYWCFKSIWARNILRLARPMPWPTGLTCNISNPANLHFHPDDINNLQSPGTYFQNFDAKIVIGQGSFIGPNVGIITSNHVLEELDVHAAGKDVIIGEKCWLGMNSVVMPGVVLGAKTVVAAGAVVTKSFPHGHCVIGGVPAVLIKMLDGSVA